MDNRVGIDCGSGQGVGGSGESKGGGGVGIMVIEHEKKEIQFLHHPQIEMICHNSVKI